MSYSSCFSASRIYLFAQHGQWERQGRKREEQCADRTVSEANCTNAQMPGGQTHTRAWPAPHGIQVKNVPFRWNTSSNAPWALCIHNKHTHTLLRTFYSSAVTLRPLSIVVLFPGSTSLPVLFPEIAFQAWNPQPFTSLEKHLCYLVPKLLKNKPHNVLFVFVVFLFHSSACFKLFEYGGNRVGSGGIGSQ